MYLKSINIYNIGPLEKCTIEPKFDDKSNPIPLILIGSNGSGKTMVSSYIADGIVETAKKVYKNVVEIEGAYYRLISPRNCGSKYSSSGVFLKFSDEKEDIEYYEKTSSFNISLIKGDLANYKYVDNMVEDTESWGRNNYKKIYCEKNFEELILNIFNKNTICYFPSDRSEIPYWVNKNAVGIVSKANNDALTSSNRYANRLYNLPIISSSSLENEAWINLVLKDLPNNPKNDESSGRKTSNISRTDILSNIASRQAPTIIDTLEKILSLILKCHHVLIKKTARIVTDGFEIECYQSKDDINPKVLENIDQFSLGESLLFNIFATILRYADQNTLNQFSSTSSITGIVIIDEIDTHLDTDLQYKVLPQLIAMFPKIQFVITTHSPLFLLGLRKNGNKYDLIELPNGNSIDVEVFSEFEKAYDALSDTQKHGIELQSILDEHSKSSVPIIYTEGISDYLHLSKAFKELKDNQQYGFLFYEHDKKGDPLCGYNNLKTFMKCLIASKTPRKSIFIFDRDSSIPKEWFDEQKNEEQFYHKGNVFAFYIPVPLFRAGTLTPEQEGKITIEHYYDDSVIRTEYIEPNSKTPKRLFFGGEFDDNGTSAELQLVCSSKNKCGKDKINIISSDTNTNVEKIGESGTVNYTFTKVDFYNHVIDKITDKSVFDSFSQIFKIIADILTYQ